MRSKSMARAVCTLALLASSVSARSSLSLATPRSPWFMYWMPSCTLSAAASRSLAMWSGRVLLAQPPRMSAAKAASASRARDGMVFTCCSCLDGDADDLVTESHGGAIDDPPRQLTAGRVDILAAGAPHGGEHASLQQLVPEALDHGSGRARVAGAGKRVERNEIDLGGMTLEQAREGTRLCRGIVHAIEHHVLEGDAAAVLFVEVVPAGGQELGAREPYLADDLRGAQVPVEALLGGRAERAVERAAHLRGDAERAAVGLGNEHHLEGLALIGAQQPLHRAVARALHAHDLRRPYLGLLGEAAAKVPGEIRHRGKIGDAALVDPAHELARTERPAAELRHERLQRRPWQAEQVGAFGDGGAHGKRSAARVQFRGAEEIGDLARGRIGRIRTVHDVLFDARGEIGPDRTGSGLLRIGRAHQVAVARNGVIAFQHLHDHGTRAHIAHQILEERPLTMHGVEALGLALRQMHHASGDDGKSGLLEASIHLTDEIAADAVWLDDGQSALERHSICTSAGEARKFTLSAARPAIYGASEVAVW